MEKEVNPLVTEAKAIKVKDPASMKVSVEMLSRANQMLDKVEAEKEKITKPLNAAIREVRLRYSPAEKTLKEAIEYLRNDQSRFATFQRQKQLADEAKIADRLKAGKLTLEGAVNKLDKVKKTDSTVSSESGMVKFKEVQVVKVNNVNDIPRKFMIPDYEAIESALKAGQVVEGCSLEIEMRPYNFR